MIRILQIGNYPPPVCGWGIHTQAVQKALSAKGVDSKVLDIGPGRRTREADAVCVPMRGGVDYFFKILSYRLRDYTFEPHVNGDSWQGYLLALYAVLVGRFTGRPAVLMFHAGPDQQYFPRKSGMWYHAFHLLFNASGAIICNLESVKKEILKYGIPEKKVHAIFSVNYQQEEIPVPLPEEAEKFIQVHKPYLFCYTLFRPEFTPEVLFEGFAQVRKEFPEAGLLIAGPREVPPEIHAMIEKNHLGESVMISGNLAHPQFLTAIQRSELFIRTHLRDGLCACVIEALSLGVPVVAAEDGIRPRSVVTYQPPEAGVLSSTITRVLKNLEHFRALVETPDVNGDLDTELALLMTAANGRGK